MGSPGEKLADSLSALYELRKVTGSAAVKAAELSRTNRERLRKAGFLVPVTRGWYLMTNPAEQAGETTSWYIAYWDFCARFLADKYGERYFLSAEQSVLLHAGSTVVPAQMIIRGPEAINATTSLLRGTSLYFMKSPLPEPTEIEQRNGLNLFTDAAAIIRATPTVFTHHPVECKTVLGAFTDPSKLLNILLRGGHSVIAGRLVGAFRQLGKDRIADQIVSTMKRADFKVVESNPFQKSSALTRVADTSFPEVRQLRLRWAAMREVVLKNFPPAPGIPTNTKAYLSQIDDLYGADAYHSLSIENYEVTPELIEKVKAGNWSLEDEATVAHRNALAAKGYWKASLFVRQSIQRIFRGESPGIIAREDVSEWYQELFAPSVQSGILRPMDLAGYRSNQVYIKNSRHIPPRSKVIGELMDAYFSLLEAEPEAAVRAILGHFFLGYIHPFIDGNGRIARFLMNTMMASGGFPWTIIHVENRKAYMEALEAASVAHDIKPFTAFVLSEMKGTKGR